MHFSNLISVKRTLEEVSKCSSVTLIVVVVDIMVCEKETGFIGQSSSASADQSSFLHLHEFL